MQIRAVLQELKHKQEVYNSEYSYKSWNQLKIMLLIARALKIPIVWDRYNCFSKFNCNREVTLSLSARLFDSSLTRDDVSYDELISCIDQQLELSKTDEELIRSLQAALGERPRVL